MTPRLLQLVIGAVIATAALAACRKEVPMPSRPDEVPTPKVAQARLVAAASAALRLGGRVAIER